MPTLQEQVNIASSGAVIQHDTEFVGNLKIDKPIIIQGIGTIRTPNADPAVDVVPKTGPVALKGLKICTTPGWAQVYDVVRFGAWQTTSLADVPQGLLLEDVEVFGQPGQEVQRGIAANGANFHAIRTKVREIHGKNAESQAIAAWNGPGPFTFEDCFLEASHICLLFGGAEARIPNLVPTKIRVYRTHFYRPLAWKGVWPCKNHFECKNAEDILLDGCTSENSWVSAQIGFSFLLTVRNEDGKNPWAGVKNFRAQNHHVKNCAGGVQLIGKDTNSFGVAGAGDGATFSNVIFELSNEMGPNGRLFNAQDFHNLVIDRIEANPSHTFLNLAGGPVPGLKFTNSLLSYGNFGIFCDGDRPLKDFAPDAQVSGNSIYGATIPESKKISGNSYSTSKPSVLPAGVGVNLEAMKAAQSGTPVSVTAPTPTPQPAPAPTSPTPSPAPTASPNGTKDKTITDNIGRVWTLGSRGETLREGVHIANGMGLIYKWQDSLVYVFADDSNWWKFNGEGWEKFGATAPGTTAPVTQPSPIPAPPPPPQPAPPALKKVAWPSGEAKQNLVVEEQWKDRYRFKRHLSGAWVEFEKVG